MKLLTEFPILLLYIVEIIFFTSSDYSNENCFKNDPFKISFHFKIAVWTLWSIRELLSLFLEVICEL
jgi:hypothetical protein